MRVQEEEDEGPQLDYSDPLSFLLSAMRCPDLPMHTRLRAASEAAKYSHSTLRAVAQVTPHDMAAVLEKARERAAGARVIKLDVVPKALPPQAIQHSPDELKPNPARSAEANGSGGFKRRI
jgi:hypothetical protein